MGSLSELKEQVVIQTPVLLFECELADGSRELWSSYSLEADGKSYQGRVLRHNLFEIQADTDGGIDAPSKVSMTLANADSHLSQVERGTGLKGAKLTVRFLFFDLKNGTSASESYVLFRGVANPPDEITESYFRVSFTNRLNVQRLLLPEVRIQKRCPWRFPETAEQRKEAKDGGGRGKFSPFFRCGYSPDVAGGTGSLSEGLPFTFCGYTRSDCEARGMFDRDEQGNGTRRFGGLEFVPSTIEVRSYGERGGHLSNAVENEARYNDFVPLVYGTAWYSPLTVFSRNDGNLTHLEVLLGMGEIHDVVKVLVNDVDIPAGQAGVDMTGTGWYNHITLGSRNGGFNLDFVDGTGNPIGDPYSSMAALSVVVPNRISEGRTLPRVQVLIQGLKLSRFDPDGRYLGDEFSNNPAWVLLDILQRCGWRLSEMDVPSFAGAAAYCEEPIEASDLAGRPVLVPRFECNMVLSKRRSAADLIRGVRNCGCLHLTYGSGGQLQARVENTLALQQPLKPDGSNSQEELDGGWPAYEFGDGTFGFTGIVRKPDGQPSLRLWSRSTGDSPNRFSVEFQDEFNDYQQDSLSLVDTEDANRTGYEISSSLMALGIANFSQAGRLLRLGLNKTLRANTYVEFTTSVRSIGLRPGDLITLTYLKEGFQRQPFRILKIAPDVNYETSTITAQIHDDRWYSDEADWYGDGGRRQPSREVGLPRPLAGSRVDEEGYTEFEIAERPAESSDGSNPSVSVAFSMPSHPNPTGPGIPLVSLSARVETERGGLTGGRAFYYGVSGVDTDGREGPLSFLIRATVPCGTDTNQITLTGLGFSMTCRSFRVYRGGNPVQLLRIADNQPIAATFDDPGLMEQLILPPDENYDHANFYWRLELQPEFEVTASSTTSVGNDRLNMAPDAYTGMTARITGGKGRGQERTITCNTATEVSVSPKWDVLPDATSRFVIAESSWHFGGMASASPVEFTVPNREGATVHICGRSANAHDRECALELSPVTRWRLGDGGGGSSDHDVAGPPLFGLTTTGKGTLEFSSVGFADFANTATITSGTLRLNYFDELNKPSPLSLANNAASGDASLQIEGNVLLNPGDLLQIDSEIVGVDGPADKSGVYKVVRGCDGTGVADHTAGTEVCQLSRRTIVVPFAKGFLGSPSSGSFSYPILLPDVRVASAELFVSNMMGDSETSRVPFTLNATRGLRTLSGGQMSLQVGGYLAVQSNAVPPLIMEDAHAVRDVYAVVREAPTQSRLELRVTLNGEEYCRLTFEPGSTVSSVVDGLALPPLLARGLVGLDILGVGQTGAGNSGRDLTVVIRL